jgi:hypothetical protein
VKWSIRTHGTDWRFHAGRFQLISPPDHLSTCQSALADYNSIFITERPITMECGLGSVRRVSAFVSRWSFADNLL